MNKCASGFDLLSLAFVCNFVVLLLIVAIAHICCTVLLSDGLRAVHVHSHLIHIDSVSDAVARQQLLSP